ncbi:hypothetical protein NC652_011713 [Populus alba x Populus x berolinensis]|nr:hypothetical protein NC652_011713 [Populus alba x Populus x berolinensis]
MQGPRLNAERDVGSITSESETLPEEKEDGECFHKGDLAGTAGPHDRSVFLCFKNADAWLPHVEEDDPPKVVSTALKTRKDNITVKVSSSSFKEFFFNYFLIILIGRRRRRSAKEEKEPSLRTDF